MSRSGLDAALSVRLEELAEQGLARRLGVVPTNRREVRDADGRVLLNLAGNDYLALAGDARLARAATEAIARHGVGSGASRLIGAGSPVHGEAERAVASWKSAEAALLLPTGYMANVAALQTLAGPGDTVLHDKLNHASLLDASRACGARSRRFAHLDYAALERKLSRLRGGGSGSDGRVVIATDAVFSMDGDAADLPALCELADRYRAVLLVDEAHSTGVLGPTGAGLAEAQGVSERVDVSVVTASKALGGLGGLICGSRTLIDAVIHFGRAGIYTTGCPAAQAACVAEAARVARAEPERRETLAALSAALRERLRGLGWRVPETKVVTPIVPVLTGSPEAATALAQRLLDGGVFAPAVRPPTVSPGASRVRLSLRSDLTDADLERVASALGSADR
ncbi:MAG: 8-amino-7-oxononanoate synthase [Planctomycetota bacterium]